MNENTRSCFCSHCRAVINFDLKQTGDTIPCWACNQDTKLYLDNQEAIKQPEKSPQVQGSATGKLGKEKHENKVGVVWIDGQPYAQGHAKVRALTQAQETPQEPPTQTPEPFTAIPGQIVPPPILPPPVVPERKPSWTPFTGILVALGGCGLCWMLNGLGIYLAQAWECHQVDGEKVAWDMGYKSGQKDHLVHHDPGDSRAKLAADLNIKDKKSVSAFENGYRAGWDFYQIP